MTCDDITLLRATETVSVSTCLRVYPLTWHTLVVTTDETNDSVGLSIISKGVRGKSLRTSVFRAVTTPSCVTSQGEEQPEGPVWGLKWPRYPRPNQAGRADEERAACQTRCPVGLRTSGPNHGESPHPEL